jgi:hypothetical protein
MHSTSNAGQSYSDTEIMSSAETTCDPPTPQPLPVKSASDSSARCAPVAATERVQCRTSLWMTMSGDTRYSIHAAPRLHPAPVRYRSSDVHLDSGIDPSAIPLKSARGALFLARATGPLSRPAHVSHVGDNALSNATDRKQFTGLEVQ